MWHDAGLFRLLRVLGYRLITEDAGLQITEDAGLQTMEGHPQMR